MVIIFFKIILKQQSITSHPFTIINSLLFPRYALSAIWLSASAIIYKSNIIYNAEFWKKKREYEIFVVTETEQNMIQLIIFSFHFF